MAVIVIFSFEGLAQTNGDTKCSGNVNGSCKTDGTANIAFDPSTMVPMTEAEIAAMYAEHDLPYTISSAEIAPQQEETKEDFSLFFAPNPAQETVAIVFSGDISPEVITITDLFGQKFNCPITSRELGNIQLDIQNLNSGLYIVHMVINNRIIQEKLWVK